MTDHRLAAAELVRITGADLKFREWVIYNVGSRSNRRVKRDILRLIALGAVFIGLNEVGDREKVLRRIEAETGYKLVRDDSQPSSGKIAALVAPDAKVTGYALTMISDRTKVGRRTAGARRTGILPPKYILTVWFNHDGEGCVGGVTHLVASASKKGNDATKRLHHKQEAACAHWVAMRQRVSAVLMGDLNAALNRDHEREELLAQLDRVANLYAVPDHHKRAISIFAVAKHIHGKARALSHKGIVGRVRAIFGLSSDHKALVFTQHRPQR